MKRTQLDAVDVHPSIRLRSHGYDRSELFYT